MNSKNDHHKSTPPQTHKKVRNPFDKALIGRLHKPICSPGMCKMYKKEKGGTFGWDIEQVCTLKPSDIVACNSQFEPSPDPALERFAEETTDKFFSQEMVMPSPLESSKKSKPLLKISSETSSLPKKPKVITRDVSAQTVLTLPPEVPPELEKLLQPFYTFTEDQNSSKDYEITSNGSLCVKFCYEENIDDDSEQTDDEINSDHQPPKIFEAHTPIAFSDKILSKSEGKAMKRTFDTPLKNKNSRSKNFSIQNNILDSMDTDIGESCFGPIRFQTPIPYDRRSDTSCSLASVSISPVTKSTSSDDEKHNFTSPESDTMATCLDCISKVKSEKKGTCFCKITPNKIRKSASLKGSPNRSKKGSLTFSDKRSLSLSSLNRSRSVQKLDFSMDMSVDVSTHDTSQDFEYILKQDEQATWSMVEEIDNKHSVKSELTNELKCIQSSTKIHNDILDETPIKGKCKNIVRSHEISKIRVGLPLSPMQMSLDSSLDGSDNLLNMEDKKIDFSNVDLKFLNVSKFNYINDTKVSNECSTSFKRIDSGFNENTFYANASSYYESAIKPSELTVTNVSNAYNKSALKEISNVHWMRVDSGFKDENSADSMNFYNINETKNESRLNDKENTARNDLERFLNPPLNKRTASVSESFTDDLTFNCKCSSTPSKNKTRNVH